MKLKGRVWKFGHHLKATYFLSGKYDGLVRGREYDRLVEHVLEDVEAGFAAKVRKNDLFVTGEAFGSGKHLEGLIEALRRMGIAGVIAQTFSAGWERDSINLGFPAIRSPTLHPNVETGDEIQLDLSASTALNVTRKIEVRVEPTPADIVAILEAGGLERYTLRRLGLT